MKYKLKNRQSIRLRGYDYSKQGAYFITICTHQRKNLFAEITNGHIKLTEYGNIVKTQWQEIPNRFQNIILDEYVIMPNHIHGIIHITIWDTPAHNKPTGPSRNKPTAVGAGLAPARNRATARVAPTQVALGEIVGAFKSICFKHCLEYVKSNYPGKKMGKIWQRNYYEHIVRNENELNRIRQYIINNPTNWLADPNNLKRNTIEIHENIAPYGDSAELEPWMV